tara:strand:- start:488 stop:856 length:369 start_codon:yes stop_codon:yes gene_type:complete
MGFFDIFKNGVSGYTDEYDYRIDVVLRCVEKLFGGGDIGVHKVKYPNGDWGYQSLTNFQAMKGLDIISDRYKNEIEANFRNSVSFNKCVDIIINNIDKQSFLNECKDIRSMYGNIKRVTGFE